MMTYGASSALAPAVGALGVTAKKQINYIVWDMSKSK